MLPPPAAGGAAVGATGAAVGATGAAVGAPGAAVGATGAAVAAGGDTINTIWGGVTAAAGCRGATGKKVRGLAPDAVAVGVGVGVAQSTPHVRLVAMTGSHSAAGSSSASKQSSPI